MEETACTLLNYAKQLAIQHPDDIVSLYSLDSICRYSSPSHKSLLGYDPDEAIGRPWTDFVAPEDQSHARLAGDDAMLNGESICFGFSAVTKTGERLPLRGTAKIRVDPASRQPFLIFQAQVVKA